MLVSLFSVQFRLLPPLGYTRFSESPVDWATHTIMPALALCLHPAAVVARQLRASLIEALSSRYIRTAWAKGGSRLVVTCKHALKNAAIPAVTVVGLQTANLLGGTVVIEKIFGIPGIGTYLFTGINGRDISVIQGVVIVFVLANILVNLLVDISYTYLNPKVRVS
jgi:peptide/nickel transport system permease protein